MSASQHCSQICVSLSKTCAIYSSRRSTSTIVRLERTRVGFQRPKNTTALNRGLPSRVVIYTADTVANYICRGILSQRYCSDGCIGRNTLHTI